ncbi:MBL fold metallo-hydrolase [Alicyclobacillus fastidiosus]|uniref:MBL fold metallo-hydrolase n=1 Tax=Alicyclobacillus fastidiosus TaxID=392011 RepID=UPI0023E9C345|nr:MBL fold metallo-hydrolase [Alicyclobacillus fastidiosus]GMA62245.1 hypothetical protein GCM10025859_26850 [Alicyclobacillus fastidiosus]
MQRPAFPQPVKMTDDIWQIDLMEQGLRYRTGAYVILDEKPTLIETGSANSHEALMAGLSAIGLSAHDLAYVVVTHVHLDHAGGAGQLIAKAPKHNSWCTLAARATWPTRANFGLARRRSMETKPRHSSAA